MANPNKTWGGTRISVNGRLLDTAPKPTFQAGGVKRTEVEADNSAGRFNEQAAGSMLDCKVLATTGVSLRELQSYDDATVVVEFDTGQTYVMRHAYTSDAVEASDGSISLKMAGPEAEELSL
jgi:hypothetical protein